jgi:hypothetical protein
MNNCVMKLLVSNWHTLIVTVTAWILGIVIEIFFKFPQGLKPGPVEYRKLAHGTLLQHTFLSIIIQSLDAT